jgi:diguanylate cyclase (GGDEF)-like protein
MPRKDQVTDQMSKNAGAGVIQEDPSSKKTIQARATDALTTVSQMQYAMPKRDRCTLTHLVGVQAGLTHLIDADETVIGREQECHVRIEDTGVSRRHCRIFRQDQIFLIEDLKSTNGTLVDGVLIKGIKQLDDGQRIQLSRDVVFKFSRQDALEAEASQKLYASAMHDPLTSVCNRRYFDEHLQAEFAFAARHGTSLSILMVDVDHFKKVNDTHGHAAGDQVLRTLADRIKKSVRAEDVVARFGGEEFVILARGITSDGALVLAERVRMTIERTPVPHDSKTLSITVSVGVVTANYGQAFASVAIFLETADEALYLAKARGRNCSVKY